MTLSALKPVGMPYDAGTVGLKAMFEEMSGDRLEVVLGQRDHTIYFTKTHRQDLLAVIEAMNE